MVTKLEFIEVSKSFPGVQALSGVSFAVERGEVHALVGENGAGKSTLIKIVAGAQPASSGEMRLAGRPYRPPNPRAALAAGVAAIYQERNWLPGRNVMFNILLGREPKRSGGRLDFPEMKRLCREVLATLHAETIPLEAPAEYLKPGEKQILEIARALLQNSSFLIMDEATSALNHEERAALFNVVRTLKSRGLSILYISHRLDEIFELADRVTVLRDGRHVSTSEVSGLPRDALIRDMIGREWAGFFPERNPSPGEVRLEVRGLSGRAFEDVSFDLRAGEVIGLAGLSGSGKEELGRALFGADPVSRGSVKVDGREVAPAPSDTIPKGMAYLPEDRKSEGLILGLPVRRNLSLPQLGKLAGRFGHLRRSEEEALARTWVDQLSIKTPGIETPCQDLSGGNQQKVALGKWLAADSKVLILAHPTQEIDVAVKFELYRRIAELSCQGRAVLLISSDLPELLGLCSSILVLRDGRIAARLPADAADQESILRHALGPAGVPAHG